MTISPTLSGSCSVDSFAPLRSGVEQRGNLPSTVTSFVGRSDDLKELGATVSDSGTRLVTLTGPGGVGKTRLAIETGWQVVDEFPDGAWMVELAPSPTASRSSQRSPMRWMYVPSRTCR